MTRLQHSAETRKNRAILFPPSCVFSCSCVDGKKCCRSEEGIESAVVEIGRRRGSSKEEHERVAIRLQVMKLRRCFFGS